MTYPGAALTGAVVVAGDVALDWLEEAVPRSEGGPPRNYRLFSGFRWTPAWGGAALLERLVEAAVRSRPELAGLTFDRLKERLPAETSTEARRYLQSLAIVKQMEVTGDDKPTRVDQFKGFTAVSEDIPFGPVPDIAGRPACLVIDDAANGCREDGDFVEKFTKLAQLAPLTILKLSRPLQNSVLMKALTTRLPADGHRVVTVVNADDLRAQAVDISRRLSWERSAVDLIKACEAAGILRDLTRVSDVLVRFCNDGCIGLPLDAPRFLVFDPRRPEDGFDQQLPGTMPGATSAFVAYITAALLAGETDLPGAVGRALTASRRLLCYGFDRNSDGKVKDYALDVFSDRPRPKVKSDFASVQLPPTSELERWSILGERLAHAHPDLAERIVREGHDSHLKDVPVAEFGKLLLVDNREIEGFRSIENLLREYIDSTKGEKPKPLSIAAFGPPGSGKSFGIKEIATNIKGVKITIAPFNLTQFEGQQDLVGAFHTARDESLKGNLPLLIFDEFDCKFGDAPWGWLKFFLAPMQDGEFKDNGQIHPLGNAIFVFAGGIAHSYEKFVDPPKELEADFANAKGRDFASRLKGYVDIQGINSMQAKNAVPPDATCIVRRAILLRSMLQQQEFRTRSMNPVIGAEKRFDIDGAVLDALLRVTEYRHGVRSLESVLTMSRLTNRDHFGIASLPSDAQLKLHVDPTFTGRLHKTGPAAEPTRPTPSSA